MMRRILVSAAAAAFCLQASPAPARGSCPLPAFADFCLAGKGDVARLRELATGPAWKLDLPYAADDTALPRAGMFTATSPEGWAFLVYFTEFQSITTTNCVLDFMVAARGGMPQCTAAELGDLESAASRVLSGTITRRPTDNGLTLMVEDTNLWMKIAIPNEAGGPTNVWADTVRSVEAD